MSDSAGASSTAAFDRGFDTSHGSSGQSRTFLWRLARHRVGTVALLLLLLVIVLCIVVPFLSPYPVDAVHPGQGNQGPSFRHWLGTDAIGRDMMTRLFYGGRVSLFVGLLGAIAAHAIGIPLGAIAGFWGRRTDALLVRLSELMMTMPAFIVILVLVSIVGGSTVNLLVIFPFFYWMGPFRITREMIKSTKEMEFIAAAQVLGLSRWRVLFRHALPNVMAPMTVSVTLSVAQIILAEAGLSFLGFGVQAPTPSWGNLLTMAQQISVITQEPWLWIPPGIMISLTVLCINFFGDALRDALDPRSDG